MERSIRVYHWLPRIICILGIVCVTISVLDFHQPELNIWQRISLYVKQLVPSFAFIIFLIIAWRWELIGGIILTAIGLMLSPYLLITNYNSDITLLRSLLAILIFIIPFIVLGILFIVSFFQKKKHHFFHQG